MPVSILSFLYTAYSTNNVANTLIAVLDLKECCLPHRVDLVLHGDG